MTDQSWGALVGLGVGLGLLLIGSWIAARRPRRVADRIAPYVAAPALRQRVGRAPEGGWGTVMLLLRRPPGSRAGQQSSLERRLGAAGRQESPEQFRLEQLVAAALGAGFGLAAGVLLAAGGTAPVGAVVLASVGALVGWLTRDMSLGRQVRGRRRRIEQALPTVAELLAFSVAAGEAPLAALERASAITSCDLSDEIRLAVSDMRSGRPFEVALGDLADRIGSTPVQAFVDGLLVAMERGTPLTDVMRAQAADARAGARRGLVELAGRKDAAMLVPVVFLILPTVVLIALFPGIQGLRLVVP